MPVGGYQGFWVRYDCIHIYMCTYNSILFHFSLSFYLSVSFTPVVFVSIQLSLFLVLSRCGFQRPATTTRMQIYCHSITQFRILAEVHAHSPLRVETLSSYHSSSFLHARRFIRKRTLIPRRNVHDRGFRRPQLFSPVTRSPVSSNLHPCCRSSLNSISNS